MQKLFKKSRGFSLVETLVAVSILSLAILATFTAVQKGLRSSSLVKDQITAFYLAQEGMEFIKNKRDENALNNIVTPGVDWMTSLSYTNGFCESGEICRVDPIASSNQIATCGSAFTDCPYLNRQTSTGLLGYTSGAGWVATNFKRSIQIQAIPSTSDEVLVTVYVSWLDKGSTKTFQVTESLFSH